MSALKKLFTLKKKGPLSSSAPQTAEETNFNGFNPRIAGLTQKNFNNKRNKINRYIRAYKKMNLNNLEGIQRNLQEFVQKNPAAARTLIEYRFNRRSNSNLSGLSNDNIESLKGELFEPGSSLRRLSNNLNKIAGGCFCRRNTRRNRSRRARKTRRCGCL